MRRTPIKKRAAEKTASAEMKCLTCGGAILKGWTYLKTPRGPEHYNRTHHPACHDPASCVACLNPGSKLHGWSYATT